jgi:ketosteroid isomerase-like protein
MRRQIITVLLSWFLVLPLFAQESKTIVLREVSVLALGGDADIPGQDILIQGDKIMAIRPTGRTLPPDAVIVDCAGKWALPGLIDTHVHLARRDLHWPDDEQEFIEILAGGITTVFDLGGRLEGLQDLKKRSQSPEWLGPRIFHCGSPLFGARVAEVDSATQRFIVQNANDARAVVRQLKKAGVDAVKIHLNVSSGATEAAIEEAHALGLLAIGHPVETSYQEAAKAGIDILEHVSGLVTDYIGGGDRKELAREWFPGYLKAWEKVQPEKNARSKMQFFASRAIFFAPTLAYELRILQDYVPTNQAAMGRQLAQKFNSMLQLAFNLQVPLLAGSGYATDDNRRVTLHDELESWVQAGLGARFAIEAATINASHALRQSEQIGQLATGMLADIVVVKENPASNIAALREPWLVIRNGNLHRVDELKKRLQPHRKDERDIRAVLELQEAAWNDGDIERFMRGYWKSEAITFASGGEITRGWNAMLERYKRGYPTPEKMGHLGFSIQQLDFLCEDWAKVFGAWKLTPKQTNGRANDQPMSHGLFTLMFQRLPEGWRIVHDHTSVASASTMTKKQ